MAADRSTADAILTEHFRYTPLSVIDDIINSINTIIYKALTALESGLLAHPPKALGFIEPKKSKSNPTLPPPSQPVASISAAETARAEIENGTHKLETLLEAAVDKNFDIFELFALQHIFNIDPDLQANVRLQHYQDIIWPLDDNSDEENDEKKPDTASKVDANNNSPWKGSRTSNTQKKGTTPRSIRRLRERLSSSRSLNLQLEQESISLSSILSQLHALTSTSTTTTTTNPPSSSSGTQGALAFLTTTPKIPSSTTGTLSTPLTTTSQFSTSQLPGLKALLVALRSKVADLPTSAAEMELSLANQTRPAGVSDDGERRRYVELIARRAVKGALGYEARGSEGEVGPSRTVGEVEGLEGIVAAAFGDDDDDDGEEDHDDDDDDKNENGVDGG